MATEFLCTLVTPEEAVFEEKATHVEVPAHDGMMGLMPGRAPMIVNLGLGVLRVTQADGSEIKYLIDGGFAQMSNDKLSLISERAIPGDSITSEQAKAFMAEAESSANITDEEFEKRQHDLEMARQMQNIAG